jgi:DNA modification methylase
MVAPSTSTELSGLAGGPEPTYKTSHGAAYVGDALDLLRALPEKSINLVLTSPPFALQRKKDYGNEPADGYVAWFMRFAWEMKRVLRDDGSLVIDIGGAWTKGQPVRSIYHFELLVALVRQLGFSLAEEFFWWNTAKLPSPAEWVTVRRIRVKDAVNCVWWLSPTGRPKADNRRVLKPYSPSMVTLLENGYKAKLRPSGHDISEKFSRRHEGAIPPNLLQIANTDSNSRYQRLCRESGMKVHPARFPVALPMFFVKFLTDAGDIVCDPFAGSNVTGEAAEALGRRWLAFDLVEEYVQGSRFRFDDGTPSSEQASVAPTDLFARGSIALPKPARRQASARGA